MGTSPHQHQYKDNWRDDDFLDCASFKTVMTRDRYMRYLTQYLHLNIAAARVPRDDPQYHPINKVKSSYNHCMMWQLRANFKLFYQHSTEMSIDEAMKGYKGCTELRQVHVSKTREVWHQILGKVWYQHIFHE